MQLTLTILSLSLSLLPSTIASGTCSSSGSMSWPPVGDCSTTSKYDTIVQACRACCITDTDCFQTCAKAAGLGKRDTIDEPFVGFIREKREIKSRAGTLNCDTNEGCYKFTDGSLLCLNLGTGLYHDDIGGHGDYYTGEYTDPDGNVQTGTSTPTTTDGGKASSIKSQTSTSIAQVQATLTDSSGVTSAASRTVSSATASAISTGGSDILYHGANIGLVGLAVGLIL